MVTRKPTEKAIRTAVKTLVDYGEWFRGKHGPDLKRRLAEIRQAEKVARQR